MTDYSDCLVGADEYNIDVYDHLGYYRIEHGENTTTKDIRFIAIKVQLLHVGKRDLRSGHLIEKFSPPADDGYANFCSGKK